MDIKKRHHSQIGIIISSAEGKILSMSPIFETCNLKPDQYIPYSPQIAQSLIDNQLWQGKRYVFKHHFFQVNIHCLMIDKQNIIVEIVFLNQPTNIDPLTGLFHSEYFLQIIEHHLNKEKLKALMILDLDYFKEINDLYGHQFGNKVLIEIAKRIEKSIEGYGYCSRLGGDEFAILIQQHYPHPLETFAKQLLLSIAAPMHLDHHHIAICASIGIALYPQDGKNNMELLDNADLAMYESKKHNRNNFHFYHQEFRQQETQRVQLHHDLKLALKREEFELYLQPIFHLNTSQIQKAEFFIRWQHPKLGLIQPSDFIPKIDNFDILLQLDDWVFNKSLKLLHQWQQKHLPYQFFINLSALEFLLSRNNLDTWQHVIKTYQNYLPHIVIEFTEDIFLGNYKAHLDKFKLLQEQGIQLAIDNFGSGISNFAYLKTINAKFLKLSPMFIKEIHQARERHFLKALIDFAHGLKLQVIAEGIETHLQLTYLKEINCDYGQGFWFSPPISVELFQTQYLPFKQDKKKY